MYRTKMRDNNSTDTRKEKYILLQNKVPILYIKEYIIT